MTLPRLSLLFMLLGSVSVFSGVLVGPPGFAGEGYFTPAAGAPTRSGTFIAWTEYPPFGAGDGNLWLGVGTGLVIAALAMSFSHARGLRLVRATASA
jgi:hypothetical protein